MEEFVVTPWEVHGAIDYFELVERFGTQLIDDELSKRLKKYIGDHQMLRRNIFYSHRDLNWILDKYEKGEKFVLYTGRGPSSNTHLGHLMPWFFTKDLQEAFDVKLYFQMTDDEKFLFNNELKMDDTRNLSYENALDIIALGFAPKRTKIFLDTEYANVLYKIAVEVAKRVTFSTAKAVFGFTNSTNIGSIFFTSMQSAPAFLESVLEKKNVPCLIPCAIDQDAHFRVCRDVAPILGYYKPAVVHCKLFPSLAGSDKMSASLPQTSIFTTDAPKTARKKVMNAFTGGAVSVKEQKEKGGNPDICSIYQYEYYLFEKDDDKMKELREKCKRGELMCGEHKQILADKIERFLTAHQEKREKAKDKIEDYMLRD